MVMRNQSGMIFPVTVMVSFFILMALSHVLALYQVEMEAIAYEQQSREMDEMMQMAVFDVKQQIAAFSDWQRDEGVFVYPLGKANYTWEKIDETKIKAAISVYSDKGIRYSATFIVSFPALDIIEWTENHAQ